MGGGGDDLISSGLQFATPPRCRISSWEPRGPSQSKLTHPFDDGSRDGAMGCVAGRRG